MLVRLLCTLSFFYSYLHADLYTVYAHGIVDTPSQIKRFKKAIITDNDHIKTIAFPDAQEETGYGINRFICKVTSLQKKTINRSKMCMGQTHDISAVDATMQQIPQHNDIILYGYSRGAAALLKYICQYNPINISAVILDASPADMPATIHPILAKLGIDHSYDKTIFSTLFPAYPQNAIPPLQDIKTLKNKKLPILLIHSKDDAKVPYLHALQLYQEFKNNGFEHVYLATIPKGKHAFLLQDPQSEEIYLRAIHSFYKQYGFPHDVSHAQNDLTQYQPTLHEIEEKIIQLTSTTQKEYEQSKTRNIIALCLITSIILAYLAKNKN